MTRCPGPVASRGTVGRIARWSYPVLLGLALLDSTGYTVIAPVIPAIAARAGVGPGAAGALVATFAVGQLAGYPIAGAAIGRGRTRTVLLVSLALVAVGDLGFIAGSGLAVWAPARFVQGVGAAGLWLGVVFAVLERWPGQEYRRMSGVVAASSAGGIAGPAIGGIGGVAGPFVAHLLLVVTAAGLTVTLGAGARDAGFGIQRPDLRAPGFLLAAAGQFLVAVTLGTLDGVLPLHFATKLTQRDIAGLYVLASIIVGVSALAAVRMAPRRALLVGAGIACLGVAAAATTATVAAWVCALSVAALGIGLADAGAVGVAVGAEPARRLVSAMIAFSLLWGAGYLVGPAAAGALASGVGFPAVAIVPLSALALTVWTARRAPA
jgi:hypothetical protein